MERTAADRLRVNEKLKALSAVIANLGAGLFATAVARWFLTGLDAWATIWIVFGLTAIAVAVQLMSFLEPEQANG
jgi:heme/copper-type cytochrome/quinol oxidase subunit 4